MNAVIVFVDDPSFAHMIEQLVTGQGDTTVHVASTFDEVLGRLSPTSAILTDMLHPEAGGLDMLERLWQDPASRAVPVIVLTSAKNEHLAVQALRAGASSYVPNRLIHGELLDTLNSVLASAQAQLNRSRVMDCLTEWKCEFQLLSDRSLVGPLVRYLQEATQGMGLLCEPGEETRLGIALEEALLNGMYHGNLEVDSSLREDSEARFHSVVESRSAEQPYCDRRLRVVAHLNRREAHFLIEDDGPGFDVSTVPDPTDPVNVERVSGRGMLLMRTFMDEVEYNDSGNRVRLVKRRQACDSS
jgi:CheY-like chemotaxis protein